MLFIEKTKGQLAYLYRLKVNLEKRLRLMPEGNLRRKKTRNKIYYYVNANIETLPWTSRISSICKPKSLTTH